MKVFEKGAIISAIIGILLWLLLLPLGFLLFVLSILVISLLYLNLRFALFNGISFRGIFRKTSYIGVLPVHIVGSILCGWAMTIACAGVLFRLVYWQGSEILLIPALFFLLVIDIIGLVKRQGKHALFYKRVLTRTLLTTAISILLLMLPRHTFLRIFHRNSPALIEAIDNSDKDPSNKELESKVREVFMNLRK